MSISIPLRGIEGALRQGFFKISSRPSMLFGRTGTGLRARRRECEWRAYAHDGGTGSTQRDTGKVVATAAVSGISNKPSVAAASAAEYNEVNTWGTNEILSQDSAELSSRELSEPSSSESEVNPTSTTSASQSTSSAESKATNASIEPPEPAGPRPPRALQAAYLRPLRRKSVYNIPVCDLQLRSYSVRNVEFMADFAMRAAYFLNLPASGPVTLPRIVERWTVPKGHFIHKKLQENYERKTLRRLIQIKDGHPEVVRLWLAFLRKHAYYGVGMKANVWEFGSINVAKEMDEALEQNRPEIEPLLAQYAFKEGSKLSENILETLNAENRYQAAGGSAPMMTPPNWRKPFN